MDDFTCYAIDSNKELPIDEREFPTDAVGTDEFRALLNWLPEVNANTRPEEIENRLNTLLALSVTTPACPRVFISHRQVDHAEALRIANLACDEGFFFWLDVLDPNLKALGVLGSTNKLQLDLATALIIELALLNCTHVLAVLTDNTLGSMWVPYEYGRVKHRRLTSFQASAWLDPRRHSTSMPEYLLLGEKHHNENDIRRSYQDELTKWRTIKPSAWCQRRQWIYGATVPLP